MISFKLAPSARRISSRTMAFLLPSRAVGAASLAVACLAALAFFGATGAAWGAGAGVRAWMAFQIRVTAVDRFEVAEGRRASEGVPNFDEPRDGPVGGELGQFLFGRERDHVVLRGGRRVVGSDVLVGV
jgi:hypothetical protein